MDWRTKANTLGARVAGILLNLGSPRDYALLAGQTAARMSCSESGYWRDDVNDSSGASGPLQMTAVAAEDTADSWDMFIKGTALEATVPEPPRAVEGKWIPARNAYRGLDMAALEKAAVAFALSAWRYRERHLDLLSAARKAYPSDLASADEICRAGLALAWAAGPGKTATYLNVFKRRIVPIELDAVLRELFATSPYGSYYSLFVGVRRKFQPVFELSGVLEPAPRLTGVVYNGPFDGQAVRSVVNNIEAEQSRPTRLIIIRM